MITYKATNKINGKVYIGQTIQSLQIRKSRHIYDSNNGCDFLFHRAIRKYGEEGFKWEVIRICDSIESLNAYEQYYILYYDSMNKGYNLMTGGRNSLHSDATKELISKNSPKYWLNKYLSAVTKEKIRQARLGYEMPEKQKQKLSKSLSGENHPMYGKHHTEKARKNMRIAAKKRWAKFRENNKRGINDTTTNSRITI